jgi:hypothetical protein
MKRIAAAILCVGLAGVGAYLEINHQSATFVWIGCVIAFFIA